MLRSATALRDFRIHAVDGEIGHVEDVLFEDENWAVRYLVVNAGFWLTGRMVLVSPISISDINWGTNEVAVDLTREEIRNSPDIDTSMPVSRQHEIEFFNYHNWPYYWGGLGLWGPSDVPGSIPSGHPSWEFDQLPIEITPEGEEENPHLRSVREAIGYRIQATDSEFGHVEDLVFDHESWAIRYIIVDTRNWWPSKSVLIASDWITRISWSERRVYVDLPMDKIKSAPLFKRSTYIDREYEERLHNHYGQQGYWIEKKRKTGS